MAPPYSAEQGHNLFLAASPSGDLIRVRLATNALTDEQIEDKIRLSAINDGGSNGACRRGTATHRSLTEWPGDWPPKEIGIVDGISDSLCAELLRGGGLTLARGSLAERVRVARSPRQISEADASPQQARPVADVLCSSKS